MLRSSRIISFICVIVLAVTAFIGTGLGFESGYGASGPYKVTFRQLSVNEKDGVESGETISIVYMALTQWVDGGDVAKNPGRVNYAGSDAENQNFLGWFEFNESDNNPYDFHTPVTGNIELFARFTNDYLVTFLNGFGEPFLTKRVEPGDSAAAPTTGEMSLFTAPSGLHFDTGGGWKDSNGQPYDFNNSVNGNITLTPSLTDGMSLVYFLSEGSQVPFKPVQTGTSVSKPDDPTREGYLFSYWSTDKNGVNRFDFSDPITSDTMLYAQWTAETVDYTVVVWMEKKNIEGDPGTDTANYDYVAKFTGTAKAGSPMDANVANARSIVASSPYTPPSWSEYGFAKSSSETVLGNGATVLNVYYKRVVYTLYFTPYNASYGFSDTANATMTIDGVAYTNAKRYSFQAKYEQDVSAVWPVLPLARITAPAGKLFFQGWKSPDVSTTFVSRVITISLDILPRSGKTQTFAANWLATGVNVNLNYMFETPDGENMPGAVSYNGRYYVRDETYSQTVFSPGNPFSLKEIKGMSPQTSNALQKTSTGFGTPTVKALTDQYLFYNRIRYTISLDSQGGSPVTIMARDGFLPGAALAPYQPDDPKWTGYEFDGWYKELDYTTRFDFKTETMPDSNLILYAKWLKSPYTVSVYDGLANSNLLGTYKRAANEYIGDPETALAAAGPAVSYKTGVVYSGRGEFVGWVIPLGPGEKTPLSTELPVTENISVYADWKPQTFTVAYEEGNAAPGGRTPTDAAAYQRGAEARVLEPFDSGSGGGGDLVAPDGKIFTGWTDESGRVHHPGEMILVTKDITLTATYEVLDKVAVYVYHINYPADAVDSSGVAITDPGNLKQYVWQNEEFPVISYLAYAPTPEPEGYRFVGWATSEARAAAGNVDYEGGSRAMSGDSDDPYDMWAVWTKYLPVAFESGIEGFMDSGMSRVLYQVPGGSSLRTQNMAVPSVTAREGYDFVGWQRSTDGQTVDAAGINDAAVTEPVTYTAQYAGEGPDLHEYYYGVVFDAGENGSFNGLSQISYQVTSGSSLNAENINVPTVKANDGFTFTGWERVSDSQSITADNIKNAKVTGPVAYRAVYSGTSSGISKYYYGVTFDAGENGIMNDSLLITYRVTSGSSLSAENMDVPTITAKEGFAFVGWERQTDNQPVTANDIKDAKVTSPITYTARYSGESPGIAGNYYGVTFDADEYGTMDGSLLISYTVPSGSSLSAQNISVPSVTASEGYEFTDYWLRTTDGQALSDGEMVSPSDIISAKVTEPVTYTALYAGQNPGISVSYLAVIFDAGGVYGTLSDGTSSTAILVEQNTPLRLTPGFTVPSVITTTPDFVFTGWSPYVDITSNVTEVTRYTAQYEYRPSRPSGDTGIYYNVRFDLGTEGSFNNIPATNYRVLAGTSLGALNFVKDAKGNPIFDISNFSRSNISPKDDFEFIGWSPSIDVDSPVYADRVYHAQYAYVPQALIDIQYSTLNIEAFGYDVYYDGNQHNVSYSYKDGSADDILPFWFDPSGEGLPLSKSAGYTTKGAWTTGLPLDEIDVLNTKVPLIFTANWSDPYAVTVSAIIKPRPLVPKAVHEEIWVGDPVPFRDTFTLSMGYDGKDQNGSPIGDSFDFEPHRSEFSVNDVPLFTTYAQGSPSDYYPIYAKAGVYGNYEIYEDSEDAGYGTAASGDTWAFGDTEVLDDASRNWERFDGWRLAGWIYVKTKDVVPDDPNEDEDNDDDDGGSDEDDDSDDDEDDSDNGGGGGSADTGDSTPLTLWVALFALSASGIVVSLIIALRRMRRSQKNSV
ncbi:MAG: InlB B-repeat-containing protein [Clostridiales Family XIII bacterium]|jgi:uncharacterized repeat protein (TIGR02543 family)|nr:InlB B-repeat-containing protein [Clostridiales Family XIII bacterium]